MSQTPTSQNISIPADGGAFDAYLARPANGPAPGVIVIQEIFGVNPNIRSVADWLAGEGYCALALDLFWRLEPNVSITDPGDAELQKAFGLMTAFDQDTGVQDIQTAINYLRADDMCTGKVGTLGFCLGGRMAYLGATRTDADVNIGYYGVGIQDMLDEATNISAPLILHIAGQDEFVPPEAQAALHAGLDGQPHVSLFDYPAQDHGFTRPGGMHYDAEATDTAHTRSLATLAQALR
ncbi:MAG: dienelactone hydrolase family protein [PS1 clade bacterium]|nr:dienelactone hydrolase family protein [PS1 clade bacterium]